jgi:hypothetical protein
MRKFVVSLIASGGAVLAAGLAPARVTAAPFPASAAMPQDAAMAPGTVTLAGVRYQYATRYYLPYCGRRPCYRRCNGYRPYYPGCYGYYAYDPPLTICGTMLCYRPRYFIAPAW